MFKFIYENGLWFFPLVFGGAAFVVVSCIRRLVGLGKKHHILSVPLVAQQEVRFTEPGRVVLWMEGPYLSRRFAHLRYDLSTEQGTQIKGHAILFRSHSSSLSRARLSLRTFDVPMPGRYTFRIEGLGEPRADDDRHQMVFMRPHTIEMVSCIVALTLAGCLLIGSLVLFLLRLLIKEAAG